jgi:hypothetical protein
MKSNYLHIYTREEGWRMVLKWQFRTAQEDY